MDAFIGVSVDFSIERIIRGKDKKLILLFL